jgi:S1-C subfamily serine protease
MSTLTTLSNDLSAAVESAARSIVAVLGGRRRASSGIHWRTGVIVTADHTLDRDDDLEVILPDGATAPATLAGRDPSTDLAVLKVGAGQTSIADKADEGDLRIGHVVLAIARSGKEGPSATMGVLSALDDAWTTWRGGRVDRFIRADINTYPGFSGGALVDVAGRVIGVNTSGLSRHFTLTLPVSTVDRVTDALLSKGRIARGYLGVGLQPVRIPETLIRTLSLKRGGGAIVVAVEPGSPADKGGLFIGDVLVALNGTPVTDVDDIHSLLGPEKVGDAIVLGVIRGGGLAEVRVTVGERPDSDD